MRLRRVQFIGLLLISQGVAWPLIAGGSGKLCTLNLFWADWLRVGLQHVYRGGCQIKNDIVLLWLWERHHSSSYRCNMVSDASSKALQIWKRLVAEWFDEVKIDVMLMTTESWWWWVCWKNVSLLCVVSQHYTDMRNQTQATRKNVDDTVDCIISTNW